MITTVGISQNDLNNTLGKLKKFTKEGQTIHLATDFGKANITVFSPNVFRIRIVKDEFKTDFSYSVIEKPQSCGFTIEEKKDKLLVKTDALLLEITKKPVRFTFKTLAGAIINADDLAFGTSWVENEVTTYKAMQDGERFVGLGEKTGNLDRRGSAYVHWNTDNPHHQSWDDPLYASFPFYIGIHHGLNYGIFFDNSYRSVFSFGASNDRFSSFGADGGEMNYYFIWHENISGILKLYSDLTGRMEIPPLWGLGYQQCRWSYFPDSEVMNIAHTFRDKKIPLDVLYLDIHYMDNYKIFTWNSIRFPKPAQMVGDLKKMGIHTTVILDPGIKVEKGYKAYEDGLKENVFVKYPDQTPYTAQVWPGWCHFPDFTKPACRLWWSEQFNELVKDGIEGFWNDMNEPASWGQSTPSLINFDWEGNKTTYKQAKNVYGLLMARSTFEATQKLMNGKRPLVLTRSGFAGLQRYSAIWTGDNSPNDDHMLLGVRMVNSIGLAGVPYCGYDVGGFMGDGTPKLFARWISIGVFAPFYRSHKSYNNREAEPWSYGEDIEVIARDYIQLRYKLLPYVYSAFYEASLSGMPIARSLCIDYPYQEKIYSTDYQNQYLFGPSLLIAPVESEKLFTKVYLPDGDWFDFYSDEKYTGNQEYRVDCPLNRLPVFAKAGSIIPMQKAVQSTSENPSDTLTIHLYKGNTTNEFCYYEDDGNSYNYKQGNYAKRNIRYIPSENKLAFSQKEGKYISKFSKIRIIFHGFENLKNVKVNGIATKFQECIVNQLQALSINDPLAVGVPWQYDVISTSNLLIDNSEKAIEISF